MINGNVGFGRGTARRWTTVATGHRKAWPRGYRRALLIILVAIIQKSEGDI